MLAMPLYIKGRDGSADALRKKAARKKWQILGHGIYCEPDEDPAALAFSRWHDIVQWAFPDAIVSHRTAISLHVYGGEMSRCNLYVPTVGGWWEKRSKRLEYDN